MNRPVLGVMQAFTRYLARTIRNTSDATPDTKASVGMVKLTCH
jgi:hypothetical protein